MSAMQRDGAPAGYAASYTRLYHTSRTHLGSFMFMQRMRLAYFCRINEDAQGRTCGGGLPFINNNCAVITSMTHLDVLVIK